VGFVVVVLRFTTEITEDTEVKRGEAEGERQIVGLCRGALHGTLVEIEIEEVTE